MITFTKTINFIYNWDMITSELLWIVRYRKTFTHGQRISLCSCHDSRNNIVAPNLEVISVVPTIELDY